MIEDYLIVGDRIRQELGELERVVARAERAIEAARRRPEGRPKLNCLLLPNSWSKLAETDNIIIGIWLRQ